MTRTFQTLAITLLITPFVCSASTKPALVQAAMSRALLAPKETKVWHSPWQDQLEYAMAQHTSDHVQCEADRPPEALATPDPLFDVTKEDLKITVSFIVGTDGRVHSPFILESGGETEDQNVLLTIQHWRYRPAMCNGVPTEAEAKVEFQGR
ncbi:MAG TPA: TonB family protein [Terriglobales bacterium]|jgi:TonB family protein|nr:TonB family protein [Terriglobales bacterium]